MKFGIADYGMNVWEGGNFDPESRWARLREIGYDGTERLQAISADDAVYKAARMRRLGADFATVLGPNPETSLQWTAAFGKSYIWTAATGQDFTTFCRQTNLQVAAAARWGVRVGLHNHMGSLVETQEQVETFLACCTDCGLILDTAHLAAVGGDPVRTVREFPDRLVAVHLKDWISIDPEAEHWFKRGRFCELGAGNIRLDNLAVMRALVEVGYDGWVFVEQDTHLQDPYLDLAISREYLRKAGF
ncbi:MAG: sugar phosphate isomerase/epimerase family protein [Armatimonadota bacterium]